jgi:hypothetical protein
MTALDFVENGRQAVNTIDCTHIVVASQQAIVRENG